MAKNKQGKNLEPQPKNKGANKVWLKARRRVRRRVLSR